MTVRDRAPVPGRHAAAIAVGAVVAVGAVGAALTLAGVSNPATGALTVMFLAVAPAAAISWLLGGGNPAATVAVGFAGALAVNASVASAMAMLGLWSPRGGLVAVAVVSAGCAVARVVRASRGEGMARGVDHGRPSQ